MLAQLTAGDRTVVPLLPPPLLLLLLLVLMMMMMAVTEREISVAVLNSYVYS